MTAAIWTLAIFGLILTVIGFMDIIKELKNQFCRKGVVSRTVFESKHPSGLTAGRVFDHQHSEKRLALKKSFTRPSGRTLPIKQSQN